MLTIFRRIRLCVNFDSYQRTAQCCLYSSTRKAKVLICRGDLPKSALDILKNYDLEIWKDKCHIPRSQLLDMVKGKDAILITHRDFVNDEFLDAAGPQLKVISTHTCGHDHIEVGAVKKRGIRMGYTPDILTDDVAEYVIGILLTCTRRIIEGSDAARAGTWPQYFDLFWLNGFGLKDSTVGIIGMGRIGLEIAKRLVPFKVKKIMYTTRTDKPVADSLGFHRVEFNHLLKHSDVIIVICSMSPETRHLLSAREFALMKPSAYVVNAARGDIIDQDALLTALQSGSIAGATLDVTTPEPLPPNHPLYKLHNCCILPHLGCSVVTTRLEMFNMSARNIVAALAGETMPAEI